MTSVLSGATCVTINLPAVGVRSWTRFYGGNGNGRRKSPSPVNRESRDLLVASWLNSRGDRGWSVAFDAEVGQPREPLRHVPVAVAEQGHRAWDQNRADDRRVDQDRHAQAEAHLLEHDQSACGEAEEDCNHDQGGAGDDPGRGLQADRNRLAIVASQVVV